MLDDGSAAVTAQLIGDTVRQLLAVTETQWLALTEEAEQKGEIYHLQSRTKVWDRCVSFLHDPRGLKIAFQVIASTYALQLLLIFFRGSLSYS